MTVKLMGIWALAMTAQPQNFGTQTLPRILMDFGSMGCLKRKLEHWKPKTWIQKPQEPEELGIHWSFEVLWKVLANAFVESMFLSQSSMASLQTYDNSVLES